MKQRLSCARRFVARIFRRFVEENFDQISASLAFTTLLSLVPLVAVILGVLSLLPDFTGLFRKFDPYVLRTILPERGADLIIGHVLAFSKKAANVTLVGFAVLVGTVYLLLQTVENAFNHVWGVTGSRPWRRRLRLYSAVLVLWPVAVIGVIAAISYAVTISLGLVHDQRVVHDVLVKLAGLVTAAILLASLYYAVPNTRVVPADACWAGIFSACGFFLMQKCFGFYLAKFPSFKLVYGAFATLPIFLVWLYLSWAIVLIGALIAATLPEFRSGPEKPPEGPPVG